MSEDEPLLAETVNEHDDFVPFVEWLLTQGYSRNECPERCPYKADEHVHLHSPGNPASIGVPPRDFILWEDGTSSHFDLTQPAAYVPVPVRNVVGDVLSQAVQNELSLLDSNAYSPWRDRGYGAAPRPSSCYRAQAGFMVHVKPGCRCR